MKQLEPKPINISEKYDANLRSYMVGIYSYMSAALGLTGLVAIFSAYSQTIIDLLYIVTDKQLVGLSPFGWIVAIAPIGISLIFSSGLNKMNILTVQMLFWLYSILLGLSLSSIFLIYTGESIANIFFITAITFGSMSLYGYTTKADLTSLGSFLFMGLIGLIITTLVNLFLKNSGLTFAISIIGVFIFIGLTAFDTQRIKNIYFVAETNDNELIAKVTIISALVLYLDFINMFMYLLQLFGKRKKE